MKTINFNQEEILLLIKLLESYISKLESEKLTESTDDINSIGYNAVLAIKISSAKSLITKLKA
ncbi:MAG: hypothetical protein U0W65_15505 [Bacteroidia bacterium]